MSQLKKFYQDKVRKLLAQELGIKNPLAVPRLTKIVVNMGTQDDLKDKGQLQKLSADLAAITGQTPQITKARVSVASFGIRAGMPVGLRVTLRKDRMYDFFQKLVSIVLPRLRDFRGVSPKSFDTRGNFSLGFPEYTVFPEIDLAKVDKPRGLEVTIVTSANDPKKAKRLLELLGMPFEKG